MGAQIQKLINQVVVGQLWPGPSQHGKVGPKVYDRQAQTFGPTAFGADEGGQAGQEGCSQGRPKTRPRGQRFKNFVEVGML